jgi:hypothetical protein
MKTVIIVSKCLRVTKFNQTESWYEFHFKGVCAGEHLKKLMLKGRIDFGIERNEEYLMYVEMIYFEHGVFTGKILKVKPLTECWDRS